MIDGGQVYMNEGIFISSFCTVIGAIPALFMRNISHQVKDSILAYSAGIMVAASTYGLIPSTLKLSNMVVLTIGMVLGVFILMFIESTLPHVDLYHSNKRFNPRILLIIIAMGIHNIPEGLSTGVSYASSHENLGQLVSFAIGLQNLPEGFLISFFLITIGNSKFKAFIYTTITGIIELSASIIGVNFAGKFEWIIPYGLAFAAGAMLFVVYKEIIPESHGDGNERAATFSFILGLISMVGLTQLIR